MSVLSDKTDAFSPSQGAKKPPVKNRRTLKTLGI